MLNGRDFTSIVRAQRKRLEARWAPVPAQATMDFTEIEFFCDLKKAYRDEEPFRNAIDACTYQTAFNKS